MTPRWILLAHQLPTRSSNARVRTWRRLQQVGAVAARNAVYVLPNTDQGREDFEWIRTDIVALGGEATVFAADALDPSGTDAVATLFHAAREADYARVAREAGKLLASYRGRKASAPRARDAFLRRTAALAGQLKEIVRIDFCEAPGRHAAEQAIGRLERAAADPRRQSPAPGSSVAIADYRGRRWVTRPRPGVDRMSSAWLIRRFIDPKAVFAFVDRPEPDDVPFDMYLGEFSHQGGECTFETLVRRFQIADPAVARIAQVVHDLDMKDARFGLPEAVAVGHLVEGLRQLHGEDAVLLERGIEMFEALARSMATAVARKRKKS